MDLLSIKKELKRQGFTCSGAHDRPLVVKFGGLSGSLHISYDESSKALRYSYGQISVFLAAMFFFVISIITIGGGNYPAAGLYLAGGFVFLTRVIITEIKVTDLKCYLISMSQQNT